MVKGLLIAVIVLIVLVLGIGFLTALNYNDDTDSIDEQTYDYTNSPNQAGAINTGNSCENSITYPCFKYNVPQQERGSGESYRPEQTKLEPCQPVPPKCELCFDSPEQTRGEGKSYIPEQTRKNC